MTGSTVHNQWNERSDLVLSCERGNQKLISVISWHSPISSRAGAGYWPVRSSHETLLFLVINMVVGSKRCSPATTRVPGENSIPWQPGTRRRPKSRDNSGARRGQSPVKTRYQENTISSDILVQREKLSLDNPGISKRDPVLKPVTTRPVGEFHVPWKPAARKRFSPVTRALLYRRAPYPLTTPGARSLGTMRTDV